MARRYCATLGWLILVTHVVISCSNQASIEPASLSRHSRQIERQDSPSATESATNDQPPKSEAPKASEAPGGSGGQSGHNGLYPQLASGIFVPPAFHPSTTGGHQHHIQNVIPMSPGGAFAGPPNRPFMPVSGPMSANFVEGQHQQQQQQQQPGSFMNSLGRRFMTLFNIGAINRTNGEASNRNDEQLLIPETQQALRNATVLSQLNKGMHSVFSNLSKMWNSTVQQQLDLLQERLRSEIAPTNSSNGVSIEFMAGINQQQQSLKERLAKQVPEMFKSMAARVNDAQESLSRLWRQVTNGTANATELMSQLRAQQQQQQQQPQQQAPSGFAGGLFDFSEPPNSESFYRQIQRSLGFNTDGPTETIGVVGPQQPPIERKQSLGTMLTDFWHNQVNPQMQRIQGKLTNVWHDLMSTRALTEGRPMYGGPATRRTSSTGDNAEASPGAIDQLLGSIDVNQVEYSLIDGNVNGGQANANAGQQQTVDQQGQQVGTKIQTSVINMQRQLNSLWQSLTNSLQGAITNAKQIVNPVPPKQPPVVFIGPDGVRRVHVPQLMGQAPHGLAGTAGSGDSLATAAATDNGNSTDNGNNNELDGKIKEIERLQRDANSVFQVLQEQQARQQQQASFGDRFKHLFNNIQVPDTFSRFGNDVNEFWHRIPGRWDQFVTNIRPNFGADTHASPRNNPANGSGTSTTTKAPDNSAKPTDSPPSNSNATSSSSSSEASGVDEE